MECLEGEGHRTKIFFRTALSETGPDKPARAVLEETALHAGAEIKKGGNLYEKDAA